MSLELWASNLWFYSLQTGILILVWGLLPWIFRLRTPGIQHLYWRTTYLKVNPEAPGASGCKRFKRRIVLFVGARCLEGLRL